MTQQQPANDVRSLREQRWTRECENTARALRVSTIGAAVLILIVTIAHIARAQARPAIARDTVTHDSLGVASARPLSLEAAIFAGSQSSEAVRIATSATIRAHGQRLSALSAYLPRLSGSANYSRPLPTPGGSGLASLTRDSSGAPNALGADLARSGIGAANIYTLGMNASFALLSPGRGDRRNAASAAARSAEIEVTAQRAQVIVDVTSAYYASVLADELLDIADSSLAQSERALEQTRAQRIVGDKSGYELLRAKVARDNQVPVLLSRRADRELAYFQLKQLLDLDPDLPVRLTTSIATPTAALPSDVVRAAQALGVVLNEGAPDTLPAVRAAVREQEEAVRQQESVLRATRAQRLPVVSVTGTMTSLAYPANGFPVRGQFTRTGTVGIGVSIPIFTGGSQRADELMVEATLDQDRAQRDRVRKSAALDARRALLTQSRAEGAYAASLTAAAQATRAYEIATVRYREGLASQLELNDARVAEAQARSTKAQAARDLLVVQVKLALLRDLPLGSSTAPAVGVGSSTGTSTPAAQ
jgi:outer membrane protein TolC